MGLSTYNPANQVRQSFCGTVDYISPEIAAGEIMIIQQIYGLLEFQH
ncbi:unnamed protein product [Paramecium sonneborni]|uniref:Uncharacterized protein n=1 Tax=Paramecium sonneborni TaxID=65129 RepID=A0A8S1L1P6_9CILI|nr:unnamed protein product [Paramecium sonneborni]